MSQVMGELTNHVWQSTIFAVAAALLTLAFRKNQAQVRYWLWLGASLKFLLPFSLLIGLGDHLGDHLGNRLEWAPATQKFVAAPTLSFTVVQMSQPFRETSPGTHSTGSAREWFAIVTFGLWTFGFAVIALVRSRDWRRIRAAVRSSTPIDVPGVMHARSAPGLLEPGVVGLFRPILLLPANLSQRLTPPQVQAVLAHEMCHVRRRDNLTAAIHMIVEAIFWFHPLVWWIGARLIRERERACDEAVLSLGNKPHDYAEGILNVCKSYLECPLSCVSGVTGSDLNGRIEAILTGRVAPRLTFAKKAALALAAAVAVIVPVAIGTLGAPRMQAQSYVRAPKFEVVSIHPCNAFQVSTVYSPSNPTGVSGTWRSQCTTVQHLIEQASLNANGHVNPLSNVTVTGGPAWIRSDLYEIDAKAAEPQIPAMMNGPILQALLNDRFKLRVHHETREVPTYELTVAEGGPKLEPFQGTCVPWDYDHPNPGRLQCATARRTNDEVDLHAWTIADLLYFFVVTLDRPVIDQTGLAGRFDAHLHLPEDLAFFRRARGRPAFSDPSTVGTDPSVVSAIKIAVAKLGLNLEPATGPGDFLVIEHVERPSVSY